MAAITWANVVDFFATLSTVDADAQTAILAAANEAFSVANFSGGESDPELRLARIYYAAHFGEIALASASTTGDIQSKTVSKDSLTVAYASSSAADLAATTGGAMLAALLNSTPARLGFVATNPGE